MSSLGSTHTRTRVVVVGGGVTGLVAAYELAKDEDLDVTLLEASDRIGGQVCTVDFDGARVDVGAEAAHLGAPHVAALVRELGLADSVVAAAPGSSVLVTRRGPVPLPAGVGPTGPTKLLPVLRSRILTVRGTLRAGLEPLMALRKVPGDIGVGEFTRRRFGSEVTDTFVDPLLGNLHGGDVDRLSLQATAPQLVATARGGESMLLKNVKNMLPSRSRAKPAPRPTMEKRLPAFASWPGGLQTFVDALATQTRGTVRTRTRVDRMERSDGHWTITLEGGEVIEAEHVLLASPGHRSAELLAEVAPVAADALRRVETASVATVVLGYDRAAVASNAIVREHNGVLVPNRHVKTMKAATNLGRKWPESGSEHHLWRASVGRSTNQLAETLSDEQLVSRVADELGELIGLAARPVVSAVYRWPQSMPQLAPGHVERIAAARAELSALPGLHVAGASVDGLGIGGTVKSGQKAAREIKEKL